MKRIPPNGHVCPVFGPFYFDSGKSGLFMLLFPLDRTTFLPDFFVFFWNFLEIICHQTDKPFRNQHTFFLVRNLTNHILQPKKLQVLKMVRSAFILVYFSVFNHQEHKLARFFYTALFAMFECFKMNATLLLFHPAVLNQTGLSDKCVNVKRAFMTPSLFRLHKWSHIRTFIFGGEEPPTYQERQERAPKDAVFWNLYGLTECSVWSSLGFSKIFLRSKNRLYFKRLYWYFVKRPKIWKPKN